MNWPLIFIIVGFAIWLQKPESEFRVVSRNIPLPKNYSKWIMNEVIRDKASVLDSESKSFVGAEDFAFDTEDNAYTGLKDGRVMKWTRKTQKWSQIARLERTLGLDFDEKNNRLICADAYLGLLSVSLNGDSIQILAREADGIPFRLTDAAVVHSDGTIYFTDASDKWTLHDLLPDQMEGIGHGRLMAYDPKTQQVKVLATGIFFANGVALSKNEEFLLVCETFNFQVSRYWLKGPKTGQYEPFLVDLPAYPDNIHVAKDGSFWLGHPDLMPNTMQFLHSNPWFKLILYKIPKLLVLFKKHDGHFSHWSSEGEMIGSWHDTQGKTFSDIATVTFNRDETEVWLGSYMASGVYRMKPSDLK